MTFFPPLSLPTIVAELLSFQSFQVGDIWNFSLIPYPILNNFLPTLPETFFILTLIAQIKKLLLFPFQEASCLRKRVWWVHFSFPEDYRNLTSPWWNHLVLKLHKHSRCLVGKPGNRIPCAQSPLGAGAARRCRRGRRRPLDPPGTAGLAPQELCHLICSGKWHWELWNPLGRAFSSCQVQTRRGYWVWLCCCWTFVLF